MNITKYLKELGYDTVNRSFYTLIAAWKSWYRSNVANFHAYKVYSGKNYIRCKRHSMGMAKKVCEDIADMLLNEHVTITISDEHTSAFVEGVLKANKWQQLGNQFQEKKSATGTVGNNRI